MDFMQQLQQWNDSGAYLRIIDAIEALPEDEQTPQLISDLARAYNNMAEPGDAHHFRHALDLLIPLEDTLGDDHCWNFRMAYAYYYLDEEGPALRYFERALAARPGDEDTLEFIDSCRHCLAFPQFEKPFRQRVEEAWAAFLAGEEALRAMVDAKTDADALTARCGQLLRPAFGDIAFELGFNGQKHELILTPEGSRAKLFPLSYFARRAPAQVLEHWNIWVGRQPGRDFTLRALGQDISAQDIQVWVTPTEEGQVALALYCPPLLPLLAEAEGKAWWLLSLMVDQILGEIPAIALIDGFDVLTQPQGGPALTLDALPQTLADMGLDTGTDPERLLERYSVYELQALEEQDADLRLDVFAGVTRCPPLINAYLQDEDTLMDEFHRDGAVPGFLYYPLDAFPDDASRGKTVLDFRDTLEEAILAQAGEDAVDFLGGATGLYCGYLDFIAWDLRPVLQAAADFLAKQPIPWCAFHSFRRSVGGVTLKKAEEDGEETASTGSFVGFALLSEARWDRDQLLHDLQADWDLTADGGADGEEDSLIFSVGDMTVAVSLMPAPVPDREAEANAANNYLWPQAVETARAHRAHLMVAVLGEDTGLMERGTLFVQIMSSCCNQPCVTGIYTSGTVFQPAFYEHCAEIIREDEMPIFNWIWFGLSQGDRGTSAYTYGMACFGRDEMEVLDTGAAPDDLRDFLANLVSYVLENDVTLHDGETIGFSETQKLPITRSEGVCLPGMTLKIGYEE